MNPARLASHTYVSMWQLDRDATNASSGSTAFAFENGAGTTDGEDDAGTVRPPSNVQVCSREYLPLRKSGPFRFQVMRALCSDILVGRMIGNESQALKWVWLGVSQVLSSRPLPRSGLG